ncbi:hypothetical protein [Actinomadura atramentaria]|nr:hypothetical protein [Actinomadura atramentaria]
MTVPREAWSALHTQIQSGALDL